jgi:Ni/Co efflux regulator RcnB
VPRPGTEPPLKPQARPTPRPQWNAGWRNNRRYDWGNWRRHHRNRFHLHSYIDPFGWAYYRYWIGWRLWPGYYSNQFWITDPWEYRLPPAPPGTRWIRYYNDALLVDMWSGEVIDVIHDFFW